METILIPTEAEDVPLANRGGGVGPLAAMMLQI